MNSNQSDDRELIQSIISEKKNIIGFDLSEKRCGIAYYSSIHRKAIAKSIIYWRCRKTLLQELKDLIETLEAKLIIWGISYNSMGKIPPRFNYIKHMSYSLFQKTQIPYRFFNEYNSTQLSKIPSVKFCDDKAAKFILIGFLRQYIKT